MPDVAAVWQVHAEVLFSALQSLGVVGILLVCLWAVGRGAYIPRSGHDALVGELQREVAKLEAEVDRLERALATKGDD